MESKFGWQRHPSPTADNNNAESSDDDNFEEEDKKSSHSSDAENGMQKLSHLNKDTSKMQAAENKFSQHELQQIVESQKREIAYLNQKIVRIEQEKQDMIDNFKLSSSVLLERLKDLEAQSSMIGERP